MTENNLSPQTPPEKRKTLTATARVGIVNRGEAAVRFIRGVKEFNLLHKTNLITVVFYLEVDKEAFYVKEADEAYPLSIFKEFSKTQGSAYLNRALMLESLQDSRCEAVWPGWGFLSEDYIFTKMIEDAQIVFLGPSATAMALLGNKISAKNLAARSKVPILPWSEGTVQGGSHAREIAQKIGYPVIVKAANTGGGRGIRGVEKEEDLERQYESARKETLSVAGDEDLFIERMVRVGRHVEVQVLVDRQGNVQTFGVRDCSLQRRNQKIIEETPPGYLAPEKIAEIESSAARLLKAAQYESAGTVEYLFDVERNEFYFMEVNTRLQVEHPITEELFRVDFIKRQILIAMGKDLPPPGNPFGSVIEARLNAEDPDKDFVPSPGLVSFWQTPAGPGIRVDSSIEQGSTIPSEFDSMIAKIICSAPTRPEAIARLQRALESLKIKIEGGTTNRAFLLELLRTPEFQEENFSTRFVEDFLETRPNRSQQPLWDIVLISHAIEQYNHHIQEEMANFKQQFGVAGRFKDLSIAKGYELDINLHGHSYHFVVKAMGENIFHINVDGKIFAVSYLWRNPERIFSYHGKRYTIQIVERGDILLYEVDGVPYPLEVDFGGVIKSPSPAMVTSIAVSPGEEVQKGDLLLTLEAMKMEMAIGAPEGGVVKNILVREGEQVSAGHALIDLEEKKEEKEEEEEVHERIFFATLESTPQNRTQADKVVQNWQNMRREFLAIFLGYDFSDDPSKLFSKMISFTEKHPRFDAALEDTLIAAMEIFVAIESLFSSEKLSTENSNRTIHYQDLLMHYFKRIKDREKGLPERFLSYLERATKKYSHYQADKEEGTNRIIFRIYKSNMNLKRKQQLLKEILVWATAVTKEEAKHIQVDNLINNSAADLLDEISGLSQADNPSLADAAIHARYYLFDRIYLRKMREENSAKVEKVIHLISELDNSVESREQLLREIWRVEPHIRSEPFRSNLADSTENRYEFLQKIIDAASYIISPLISIAQQRETKKSTLALELLGKRFVRDRKVEKGEVIRLGRLSLYQLVSIGKPDEPESNTSQHTFSTLVAVLDKDNYKKEAKLILQYVEKESWTAPPEIIFLSAFPGQINLPAESDLIESLPFCQAKIKWLCCGFSYDNFFFNYRTLIPSETKSSEKSDEKSNKKPNKKSKGKWIQDSTRASFNPLFYRELRIYRLSQFDLEIVYRGESVYTVLLKSKENPKDQRLFVLAEVSDSSIELQEDGNIRRIFSFEHAFSEAIGAMRSQQAKGKNRLHWNRIIVHIRSLLKVNLKQIKEYSSQFSHRALGLGLEKVVIYSRSSSPKKASREIEMAFENVSGHQFSLRGQTPSEKSIRSMNKYVAKVVRSRQRGVVYPYEVIQMITRTSSHYSPQDKTSKTFPRGEFEEYDLEYNEEKKTYQTISVHRRPYGQNTCNIIFGIITNISRAHSYGLKRVLILGDPTTDMGALAEEECRRIIAALDLAEELSVPVEWIPISAGARIDMVSGTENLDWTAQTLRRIIEFTQKGGEINIIVAGTNVGAQSYWNAEATMLMHTKGLLIMTDQASMLLTGKKALDFSGSVSARDNIGIGGVEHIMGPNGEAQIRCRDLIEAYHILFQHYDVTYVPPGEKFPLRQKTTDPHQRNICSTPYNDEMQVGFSSIGDILSIEHNSERKKPFDIRQVMKSIVDQDFSICERWQGMKDAETVVVWETRLGGLSVGMVGIESRPLPRLGAIANDGPETWSGGTLFPKSSKKLARAINSYSNSLPMVVIANLSGFDGSPESLRNCQLEYGAEIGRAVVNFQGPIIFVVVARYHGGAYVVFSRTLNPNMRIIAVEGTFASVIGGAPAAAVVFPKQVLNDTYSDPRVIHAQKQLQEDKSFSQKSFDNIFQDIYMEKQSALAQKFDQTHSIERARKVGSIDEIVAPDKLRPHLIQALEEEIEKYLGKNSESRIQNPE